MDLAGGETAQMPGLYAHGHFDLAGTIVGVVEEDEALHGHAVTPGDVLLGYASTGLHTNGYTLARKVASEDLGLGITDEWPGLGTTVADAFLAVHRSYARGITPVLGSVHALAHITGGGIPGNLVRVLPDGCEAVVEADAWTWPPLFQLIQQGGKVSTDEMRDVFNLGIGMIAVLPESGLAAATAAAASDGVATWTIGRVAAGTRGVRFTS
jgi:phosphoribosylformylglycinamidine cyclo-ligase